MSDAPLFFRKYLGALKPVDELAAEAVRKIGGDEVVTVTIKRTRNVRFHRKFFALMNLVFQNQEHYPSLDIMLAAFKVAAGHCFPVIAKGGQTVMVPKSISFSKMDESAFEEFWSASVSIVITRFLPGVKREDLEAEIMTMVS